ncbi:MAG: ABC transporter substrate-binding protein [Okeania sp. SIO3B3]|nr:ABC transporter substrate-binding protein [Okeania sp. SIO3B3]
MKPLLTALCLLAVFAVSADSASGAKDTYTISVTQIVEHPALDAVRKGFEEGFAAQGLKAEYNVHIAQGNIATANQIASQMLGEGPDLVLAIATPTAQAAAQKIKDIPIVITAVTDPVGAGLAKSLDAPGANITGMTDRSPVARQLELIKEIVPGVKTLGTIYNAGEANSVTLVGMAKDACKDLGWKLEGVTIANSSAVFQAAKSLVGRVDAIYIPTDNTVITALESVVKVADDNDIPLFAADTDSVKRGAIAALAVDYYRMGKQSAVMAKRILVDGEKTATMPIEDLKDLELFINPTTAKKMGVTLPASVLDRADKVVE